MNMNRPYALETQIAEFAQTYNAGRSKVFSRAWSGEVAFDKGDGNNWFTLVHYSTPIVRISLVATCDPEILEGIWNSVSDIQGVNKAFKALSTPYHYTKTKGLVQIKPWSNQPDCFYQFDGKDTDGTKWFKCLTHDELAPSDQAPCAGYKEEAYNA